MNSQLQSQWIDGYAPESAEDALAALNGPGPQVMPAALPAPEGSGRQAADRQLMLVHAGLIHALGEVSSSEADKQVLHETLVKLREHSAFSAGGALSDMLLAAAIAPPISPAFVPPAAMLVILPNLKSNAMNFPHDKSSSGDYIQAKTVYTIVRIGLKQDAFPTAPTRVVMTLHHSGGPITMLAPKRIYESASFSTSQELQSYGVAPTAECDGGEARNACVAEATFKFKFAITPEKDVPGLAAMDKVWLRFNLEGQSQVYVDSPAFRLVARRDKKRSTTSPDAPALAQGAAAGSVSEEEAVLSDLSVQASANELAVAPQHGMAQLVAGPRASSPTESMPESVAESVALETLLDEAPEDVVLALRSSPEFRGLFDSEAGAVLAARREVLGERHPGTLIAMENLASTLREQGKHAEAEPMQREVLAARREVLGERHPGTLTAMKNLASTLREQGKHAEAEAMSSPQTVHAELSSPAKRSCHAAPALRGLCDADVVEDHGACPANFRSPSDAAEAEAGGMMPTFRGLGDADDVVPAFRNLGDDDDMGVVPASPPPQLVAAYNTPPRRAAAALELLPPKARAAAMTKLVDIAREMLRATGAGAPAAAAAAAAMPPPRDLGDELDDLRQYIRFHLGVSA